MKIPFRKILAPTDFSEASLSTVEFAARLARHFGADLLLVHVVMAVEPAITPGFPHSVRAPHRQKELADAAFKKLHEIVAARFPAEQPVEFIVVPGKPAEQILGIAREKDADLIIISTHGEGGFRRAIFGSVADVVIRNAECPVLSARSYP